MVSVGTFQWGEYPVAGVNTFRHLRNPGETREAIQVSKEMIARAARKDLWPEWALPFLRWRSNPEGGFTLEFLDPGPPVHVGRLQVLDYVIRDPATNRVYWDCRDFFDCRFVMDDAKANGESAL